MACSGVILLAVAVTRLSEFEPGGRVTMGLIIAVLGVLTNGWFWRCYSALSREQYNLVIAAQQLLYWAKTTVDLCVVIAQAHPTIRYVDMVGSVIVAGYLFGTGCQ
jgi:hypothetical protein